METKVHSSTTEHSQTKQVAPNRRPNRRPGSFWSRVVWPLSSTNPNPINFYEDGPREPQVSRIVHVSMAALQCALEPSSRIVDMDVVWRACVPVLSLLWLVTKKRRERGKFGSCHWKIIINMLRKKLPNTQTLWKIDLFICKCLWRALHKTQNFEFIKKKTENMLQTYASTTCIWISKQYLYFLAVQWPKKGNADYVAFLNAIFDTFDVSTRNK